VSAATTPAAPGHIRHLLAQPQVRRLFGASMVGRLPMGALGIVLILHVRELTGSYAAGGLAAGGFALGLGVSAPVVGRLIDRRGQTRVILVAAAVAAAAIVALAALPPSAPLAAILALACLTGAAEPPLGACMRALWPALAPGADRLHAAYAIESVAIELTYVLGPLVIAGAVATQSPPAALVVCAGLLVAGTVAFAATPASRGARRSPASAERSAAGALAGAGVRTLLLTYVCVATGFGVLEVAIAAFAEAEGTRAAAGPLLAVWGVGSIAGGVLAARAGAPADPPRRFGVLLVALGLCYAPLLLAPGIATVAPLLVLAGLAVAPAIAGGHALLTGLAPDGSLTEAFAWAATAFGAGFAIGGGAGGALVEWAGPDAGFALATAAALLAAALAAARRPTLSA